MADLSIFKLDSEIITIKDTTARQTADSAKTLADSAKTLATTASGNAATARQTADSAKTLATTASDNATTARQTADSAKTLATTASDNATTALNKINELESEISALHSSLNERMYFDRNKINSCGINIPDAADRKMQLNLWMPENNDIQLIFTTTGLQLIQYDPSTQKWNTIWSK